MLKKHRKVLGYAITAAIVAAVIMLTALAWGSLWWVPLITAIGWVLVLNFMKLVNEWRQMWKNYKDDEEYGMY